ncbi:MAG: hypothetical protein HYZ53_00995 [Planctomycetes bacterium]|nr:hypothetical protein [Planctomycetota bacterium]
MIELIMSMVILGIISGVTALVVLEGGAVFTDQNYRANNLEVARLAIQRVSRDILHIKEGSTANVTAFSATSFSFKAFDDEMVTFAWTAPRLFRNAQVLADHVTDFNLEYWTESGGTPLVPEDIWRIKVQIRIKSEYGGETFLRTCVFPRRLSTYVDWREE